MPLFLSPLFWFQPIFYAFHGWLATELALWMLFHPYEEKVIPGTQLKIPFTPGIFPKGRKKLSVAIAQTITEVLLTPGDIQKQAQKLITPQNINAALQAISDSLGQALIQPSHYRLMLKSIDTMIPTLSQKLVETALSGLQNPSNSLEPLEKWLETQLLEVRLTESQSEAIAHWVLQAILSPPKIRELLIEALTPETCALLEKLVASQTKGLQGIIVHFMDLKKGFLTFRSQLIDQPEVTERAIAEILTQARLEKLIQKNLLELSFAQFPHTKRQHFIRTIRQYCVQQLTSQPSKLEQLVCQLGQTLSTKLLNQVIRGDITFLNNPQLKQSTAEFLDHYLHAQLELLLAKALPAISLNTVIIDKIDQFSAKELENTIQRICHRELRGLAVLGGFLGFWLGLVSNLIVFWGNPLLHKP